MAISEEERALYRAWGKRVGLDRRLADPAVRRGVRQLLADMDARKRLTREAEATPPPKR